MDELLPKQKIDKLTVAFNALPFSYSSAERRAVLTSVSKDFVNFLPNDLPNALQLKSDLGRMNTQGVMADGSLPLLQWLNSVASLAAGTAEQPVFLKAADDVSRKISGAPRLDPKALPEYKEEIVHENDMVLPTFLSNGLEAGISVAKIFVDEYRNGVRVMKNSNPIIHLGTGWLLARDLLLTNHHVINARGTGEAAAAEADFLMQGHNARVQFDFDAATHQGTSVAVLKVVAWDARLDYALLRVEDTGRNPLRIRANPLEQSATNFPAVNIIQHPGGQSKRYAIRNNLVSAVTPTDVRYFTDTQGGSSGSPVLDDSWEVVALHRGSTYAEGVKFQGRDTAWINLGTAIHAILNDIKDRYPQITV